MKHELQTALKRLCGDDRSVFSGREVMTVEAIERRHGVRLPDDFRSYLCKAAPLTNLMLDSGFAFWPPEEIRSVADECPHRARSQINPEIGDEVDDYLVFADCLAWCYGYAICCSDGQNRGKVVILDASRDRFVADSFIGFINHVADGAQHLHPE